MRRSHICLIRLPDEENTQNGWEVLFRDNSWEMHENHNRHNDIWAGWIKRKPHLNTVKIRNTKEEEKIENTARKKGKLPKREGWLDRQITSNLQVTDDNGVVCSKFWEKITVSLDLCILLSHHSEEGQHVRIFSNKNWEKLLVIDPPHQKNF